jgi:beta-lactam-binding protein with PASTA domain
VEESVLAYSTRSIRAGVVAGVACLALAGCGGTESPPPQDTPVPPTVHSEAVASPTPTTHAAAAKIKAPDGVGLDYQAAQDLWRAAGLHVAPATDATGAHRLPLIDRNWTVVAQDPKAGATIAAGSFITATVKKDTDG